MTYKLFVDDIRDPITNDWIIARSSSEAITIVAENSVPEYISFDHDLGGDDTSIVFINWLTEQLLDCKLQLPDNFDYSVHSQNPIGKNNIIGKMDSLIKHFKR